MLESPILTLRKFSSRNQKKTNIKTHLHNYNPTDLALRMKSLHLRIQSEF